MRYNLVNESVAVISKKSFFMHHVVDEKGYKHMKGALGVIFNGEEVEDHIDNEEKWMNSQVILVAIQKRDFITIFARRMVDFTYNLQFRRIQHGLNQKTFLCGIGYWRKHKYSEMPYE